MKRVRFKAHTKNKFKIGWLTSQNGKNLYWIIRANDK